MDWFATSQPDSRRPKGIVGRRDQYFIASFAAYDISNPTKPILLFDRRGFNGGDSITIDGDLIFMSNDQGDLDIYSILDPKAPLFLSTIDVNGSAHDIAISDQYIFVSGISALLAFKRIKNTENFN
jgi:hypothetical protein